MDVRAEFLSAVRAAGRFQQGDIALLGVSGGADSLAMLHLFGETQESTGIRPQVLHLNHHIRGEEADADAAFVAGVCAEWKIPCRVVDADVPALAKRERLTVEDAARRARYRALAEEAERVGARVIAVAHNADDQAETVLMHFLRGAGMNGLRGMRPVTPLAEFAFVDAPGELALVRPLLGIPRAAIEDYCAENGLTPRVDQSNFDTTYTRNRIRHEVMPLLETINPAFKTAMGRSASIFQSDYEALTAEIEKAWAQASLGQSENEVSFWSSSKHARETLTIKAFRFDRDVWRGLLPALQRGMVLRALRLLDPSSEIDYLRVERAVAAAAGGQVTASNMLGPGQFVIVNRNVIAISNHHDLSLLPPPDFPVFHPMENWELVIPAPGRYVLPGTAWEFVLEHYTGPRSGPEWDDLAQAKLSQPFSADHVTFPMRLRPRHPIYARTFQPFGMGGKQVKIKDFLQRPDIPQEWRHIVPILVFGDWPPPFTVVWICGWRLDGRFAVAPETKEIWLARFEKGT